MDPMDCQSPELSVFSLMNAFVLQLVLVAVFAESPALAIPSDNDAFERIA